MPLTDSVSARPGTEHTATLADSQDRQQQQEQQEELTVPPDAFLSKSSSTRASDAREQLMASAGQPTRAA